MAWGRRDRHRGAQLGREAFALPISLDLTGRRSVVVGGGVVGEDMARTLLEAGAQQVNWRGLASSADTIVVPMGIASPQHIATELMLGGNGTTPLQRVITAPIENLPQLAARANVRPPAVIVIGEVVRFRDRIRWFDQDPQAQSPTILPGSAREGQPT